MSAGLVIIIGVVCVGIYFCVLRKSVKHHHETFMETLEKEMAVKREKALSMSHEEMAALSDEELFDVILTRVETKAREGGGTEAAYLSEEEKVAEVVFDFWDLGQEDEEIAGMRAVLGSVEREYCVPRMSECFEKIGAYEHKRVFDKCIHENNIDVHNLSQFARCYEDAFAEQEKIYDFSKTDAEFAALPKIENYLTAYIRNNIERF